MICPCCGQNVTEIPVTGLPDYARFPRQQRTLLELLVALYPDGITGIQAMEAIHPGVTSAEATTARVQICRIRRKLKGSGWTISHGEFNKATYSRYKLVRDETSS